MANDTATAFTVVFRCPISVFTPIGFAKVEEDRSNGKRKDEPEGKADDYDGSLGTCNVHYVCEAFARTLGVFFVIEIVEERPKDWFIAEHDGNEDGQGTHNEETPAEAVPGVCLLAHAMMPSALRLEWVLASFLQ